MDDFFKTVAAGPAIARTGKAKKGWSVCSALSGKCWWPRTDEAFAPVDRCPVVAPRCRYAHRGHGEGSSWIALTLVGAGLVIIGQVKPDAMGRR